MEKVILVDKKDKEVGIEEKLKAHKDGKLHRAFSIFVFNAKGELLLQKRAKEKYHSGGLWSNTCCGHPRPKEILENAARRRLREEMGFDCSLNHLKSACFIYKVKINDLFENEYDHIFIGKSNQDPLPNSKEVDEYKWIAMNDLRKDISLHPNKYTYWFKASIENVLKSIK
ncbi:isopentenyl-diphosphate Delta-isomerase [Patescibacteria group bacterium]|nr:MAG: isopentenyl-diphosphate Delta-isomerase [Patescibacteria group bacterium]